MGSEQYGAIDVVLNTGIDEYTRTEVQPPTGASMAEMLNVRWSHGGAVEKRYGHTSLGTPSATVLALGGGPQGPVAVSADDLIAYQEALASWRTVGRITGCIARRKPTSAVRTSRNHIESSQTLRVGNLDWVAWVSVEVVTQALSYPQVQFQAFDATSGAPACAVQTLVSVIPTNGTIAQGQTFTVRLAQVPGSNDVFLATATNVGSAPSQVRIYTLSASSPGSSSVLTTVGNASNTSVMFDMCVSSASVIVVVSGDVGGNLYRLDPTTGTVQASIALTTPSLSLPYPVIEVQGSVLWLAYWTTTTGTVRASIHSLGTLTQLSVTTRAYGAALDPRTLGLTIDTSNRFHVILATARTLGLGGAPATEFVDVLDPSNGGGGALTVTSLWAGWWSIPTSRPWCIVDAGGVSRFYCAMAPRKADDSTIIVEVPTVATNNTLRPVSVLAPRLGSRTSIVLPNRVQYASGIARLSVVSRRTGVTDSVNLVTLDFADAARHPLTDYRRGAYAANTAGAWFDGGSLVAPIPTRPPPPVLSTPSAGAITTSSTSSYVVVYEWSDAAGNVYQSAPSDPVTIGPLAAKSVNIDVPQWGIAYQGKGNFRASVYRTVSAGTTYYRIPIAVNGDGYLNDPQSFPALQYSTIFDNATDAEIITQPQLYTQPGVVGAALQRQAPPSLRTLCVHRGRLFGVDDTGSTIWYSSLPVDGEGVWWTEIQTIAVGDGATINALASLDGRLYAFVEEGIYVIDGDGPSDNGVGGDFIATRLSSDLGCVNERSIGAYVDGVFFESRRGIDRLSRSQTVDWLGSTATDTLAAYPRIVSTTVSRELSIVRFVCLNAAGTDGRTICYDYLQNAWSVDALSDAAGASRPIVAGAITRVGGANRFVCADPTGLVSREDSSTRLDLGSWVGVSITSHWLRASSLQGEQQAVSVNLLGRRQGNADLTIELGYDYRSAAWSAPITYDAAAIDSVLNTLGRLQLECIADVNGRSQAIRIRVRDATPSLPATYPVGTGAGAEILALSLAVSPQSGRVRLPSGAR